MYESRCPAQMGYGGCGSPALLSGHALGSVGAGGREAEGGCGEFPLSSSLGWGCHPALISHTL